MNLSPKALLFASVVLLSFCTQQNMKFNPLISVDELMAAEGMDFKLIDCRDAERFQSGHLPGAINLDWEDLVDHEREVYGFIAKEDQVSAELGDRGIRPSDQLILYDDDGAVEAARVWWVLKNYGFEKVCLLDGGLLPWKSKGNEVEMGPGSSWAGQKINLKRTEFHNVDITLIRENLNNEEYLILDVRTREEFIGELIKSGAESGGRIPGSLNLNYYENYELDETGKIIGLKSFEDLRSLYLNAGVGKEKIIIPYCHTAVRSSLTTFVLVELLGYKRVLNYDGSWREWSREPKELIEKG